MLKTTLLVVAAATTIAIKVQPKIENKHETKHASSVPSMQRKDVDPEKDFLPIAVVGDFPLHSSKHQLPIDGSCDDGSCEEAFDSQWANEFSKKALMDGIEGESKKMYELLNQFQIDLPTTGLFARDNFFMPMIRSMKNVDLNKMEITGKISLDKTNAQTGFNPVQEWVFAQKAADEASKQRTNLNIVPPNVKMTMPGPMTLMSKLKLSASSGYVSKRAAIEDFVEVYEHWVKELILAGCKSIQIDEPAFLTDVQNALAYGVHFIDGIFDVKHDDDIIRKGLNNAVQFTLHLPRINHDSKMAYQKLAQAIDASSFIDQISLDDSGDFNDLGQLLPLITKKRLVLNLISASSHVENIEHLKQRIQDVLGFMHINRLILGVDCGNDSSLLSDTSNLLKRKLDVLKEARDQVFEDYKRQMSSRKPQGGNRNLGQKSHTSAFRPHNPQRDSYAVGSRPGTQDRKVSFPESNPQSGDENKQVVSQENSRQILSVRNVAMASAGLALGVVVFMQLRNKGVKLGSLPGFLGWFGVGAGAAAANKAKTE